MARQRKRGASVRRKHEVRRARPCSEDDDCSRGTLPGVMPAMFRSLWLLAAIFVAATAWLYFLARNAPNVDEDDGSALKFPSSVPELQRLAALLNKYYATHPGYVMLLYGSAYVYKQTFSIPGSALLNVLAGALFGVWVGFPLCVLLTAVGASFCFALSKHLGKEAIQSLFPAKVAKLQAEVERNRGDLLYFLLFLRLFPMTPNWLVTLASPIVGVPYRLFLVTIVLGLVPYNFVCVQAGEMLATLTTLKGLFTVSTLGKMSLLAFAVLGPSLFVRRKRSSISTECIVAE